MRKCGVVFMLAALVMLAAIPAFARNYNYDDVRIKKFPIAMQCWTFHEFTFYETLEKVEALGIEYLEAYRGQKLSPGTGDLAFGPDLTDDQLKEVKARLMKHGISLVSYGVVGFDNNEESMRRVFDFAKKMGIRTIVTEPAFDDYSLMDKMAQEYRIHVAIHNHAVPNKYGRPQTPLYLMKDCSSWLGVCPDTGHYTRSGIDPVEAVSVLEGRIKEVHLKDLREFGVAGNDLDVPFGQGKGKIHDILAELTLQDFDGFLVVEHENKNDLQNPAPPIRKGIDYIKGITYYQDYEQILGRSNGRYNKQGWNHYGPGYFELCEESGVLTSSGGMGLLWYKEKLGDFVLELDFKCLAPRTNSGVFYRVPEIPTSNDYIYHSFEIQIDDASTGIHHTGAAYDAEAPKMNASNPTGEWNHYKITCIGDRIQVELNGADILDWKMEPRGKIRDFAREGYIGLQNHDSNAKVQYRNIYIKEL